MIQRTLSKKILELSKKFPVIFLTGPRQSGKTTLTKSIFPDYTYISLEDLDIRRSVEEDPRRFLHSLGKKVILDEAQYAPELFSYIQTKVDESKEMGQFILTGSQNFLLMEKITQSLAGRAAVLHLLPLTLGEISHSEYNVYEIDDYLFRGSYPAVYDRNILSKDWYQSYITTYIERDVRQLKQISDLNLFQRFMKLCAGRTGQLLNLSSLATEVGVSHTTIRSWLSVLEASFVIFFLQPYYKNFNKRIVKQSKLYFYDTGLVCALLDINNVEQIHTHYLRGALFETLIVSEFLKQTYHHAQSPHGYFWRDHRANEIDYVFEENNALNAVEIKSGESISSEYFRTIQYFQNIVSLKSSYVIYAGEMTQEKKYGKLLSWRDMEKEFFTS